MSASCGHDVPFDGLSAGYKRRLKLVLLINAAMFAVEMTAGLMAQSQALQADALDFLGDSLTYAISLAVIGASASTPTTRRTCCCSPRWTRRSTSPRSRPPAGRS